MLHVEAQHTINGVQRDGLFVELELTCACDERS
jgi:hypothetical protein